LLLTGCSERSLEMPSVSQASSDLSQPPADLEAVDAAGMCPAAAPKTGTACSPHGLVCTYDCEFGVCKCTDAGWKCEPGLC
jgi:hypothetical protein